MAEFVIEVQGGKELAAKLRKYGVSILDLSHSMDQTGAYLSKFWSGEVFASRGRVIGEPWPALNDAYATFKARRWPGRPPLFRTGLMNSSFKHKSTKLSATLWNESKYFEYHQEGRGVPQRVMMKVDRQREDHIKQFVADDLETKQREADV
ncbi:hypothetical protein J2X12_004117 [Pseudarthrobacter oxydans]|uniref:Uncharacterized protein n=1 Tax=Pseudarthrobacter oxydans TaxID=1671 RepID=A0AAW8NEQ3_PSEOX|nr:hypothetical protein [Pseudarthrobacter oxydans]MDR6794735.1 hypothetical protein [Pseudarthrobacter oxydans]MDR7166063.1 hypothetical protein [Pseudarthrobacter oxydans]